MDDRDRIIRFIAEQECKRIERRVVRELQGMARDRQSGADSGLANLWDEICVQMQGQEAGAWDYYVELTRDMIVKHVHVLSVDLTKAIWLQTDEGLQWIFDDEEPAEIDYSVYDVVEYTLNQFVLKLAADWKNRRISKFLDRDLDF